MAKDMQYRDKIISDYMGKLVHVIIDRPIGYCHDGVRYLTNYGYIPGLIAGDGEEQDAYILGIKEPMTEFTGQVIGAVRRKNDCEDKLVVAPEGRMFHQGQIAQAVHFIEKYFDVTVDALFRKSCGVIPYRQHGNIREYLILLQKSHTWSFPKGHMEIGETEEQTALRELKEETGLDVVLIPGRYAELTYEIPPYTRKQVVLFLGAVDGSVTCQESEIVEYKWVKAQELQLYLHPDTYKACVKLLDD